jgi:hypothetical protein
MVIVFASSWRRSRGNRAPDGVSAITGTQQLPPTQTLDEPAGGKLASGIAALFTIYKRLPNRVEQDLFGQRLRQV